MDVQALIVKNIARRTRNLRRTGMPSNGKEAEKSYGTLGLIRFGIGGIVGLELDRT